MEITPEARGLPFILRADDPETLARYPYGFTVEPDRDEADDVTICDDFGAVLTIPADPEVFVYRHRADGGREAYPLRLAGPFHYRVGDDGEFVELKAEGGVIRDE